MLEIEERLSRSDSPFAAEIAQGRPKRSSFWVAPAVLMLTGAGVMLGSVAASLPIAIAGALVFAAGLGLALIPAAPAVRALARGSHDQR